MQLSSKEDYNRCLAFGRRLLLDKYHVLEWVGNRFVWTVYDYLWWCVPRCRYLCLILIDSGIIIENGQGNTSLEIREQKTLGKQKELADWPNNARSCCLWGQNCLSQKGAQRIPSRTCLWGPKIPRQVRTQSTLFVTDYNKFTLSGFSLIVRVIHCNTLTEISSSQWVLRQECCKQKACV